MVKIHLELLICRKGFQFSYEDEIRLSGYQANNMGINIDGRLQ